MSDNTEFIKKLSQILWGADRRCGRGFSLTSVHAKVAFSSNRLYEAVHPETQTRRQKDETTGVKEPQLQAILMTSLPDTFLLLSQGRDTFLTVAQPRHKNDEEREKGRLSRRLFVHVPVELLPTSLVLQACLRQVDWEHAGDPDHAGHASVDQLGWKAVEMK